jgi:hypothetical protein
MYLSVSFCKRPLSTVTLKDAAGYTYPLQNIIYIIKGGRKIYNMIWKLIRKASLSRTYGRQFKNGPYKLENGPHSWPLSTGLT